MSLSEPGLTPASYLDFAALADGDAEFAAYYNPLFHSIDFGDPDAVRQLTISTLKFKYGLSIELPNDRLCPPVPNRADYVDWIKQLIDSSDPALPLETDPTREVVGFDIGVGSSCIYPLISLAANPNWTFLGTDIDQTNISNAEKNVSRNKLSDRIILQKTTTNDNLLCLDRFGCKYSDQGITFTMCNPPFFTSIEEMRGSGVEKKLPPSAVCTGAEVEMVTEGGDLGFACRILAESLHMRDKAQWFTCMMGKKSSLQALVEALRRGNIHNWAVACLDVGGKTKRWCVGWSFGLWRPSQKSSRLRMIEKSLLPSSTESYISFSVESPGDTFSIIFKDIPVAWKWDPTSSSGLIFAPGIVWSRTVRRKRRRDGETAEKMAETIRGLTSSNAAFAARIHVAVDVITVRWLKGEKHEDFVSFCGMIRTKLRSMVRILSD